jgi:hypothetical protein
MSRPKGGADDTDPHPREEVSWMRTLYLTFALAALGVSAAAFAQNGQPSGSAAASQAKAAPQPFDAHDLSGVYILHQKAGFALSKDAPPMTPWAKAKYDANVPGIGPRSKPLGNDPMMICDPVGYPRVILYNDYPSELVQTPGRIIQFFDYFNAHRIIWTDGRDLPTDPDPWFYGHAVGHWDGDVLVIDSNGYDERSWLDADGHPHSDQMRMQERYHKVDHDTVEFSMTLTDPKAYTAPWVGETKILKLAPAKTEIREDLCVTSDEEQYKNEMRAPAAAK